MTEVALMDTAKVKTDWAKPQANPLEGMSQQDINKLLTYRSELLMELSQHYVALTEAIYKLPIHVVFRQHAFLFLDTAECWAKKGIDNVWEMPVEKLSAEDGA
jgi:hypothetical protein